MAITRMKAKSLCTATEMALVDLSAPKEITKLTAAQLRLKVARTRKLLDKWRDQAESQRRAAQSKIGGRQTSAAGRSAEKAQLFAEVLQRFESQLAKTPGEPVAGTSSRKESPRKVRNRQHRATRAAVRDDLAQSRLELSAKKRSRLQPAKTKAVTSTPPKKSANAAEPVKVPAKRSHTTRVTTTAKNSSASASVPASQPIIATGKQRRAATRAKQNRLQAAGIKRIQKHASARNKRNQAKRDSR